MNSMKREKDMTLKDDAVEVLHSICQQIWKMVALYDMAYSFIELDKAVAHVIGLVSFL